MYPSSQLTATRASGGRSVAAMAAGALVVSLVSVHLALVPRAAVPAAPAQGEGAVQQQTADSDRLGIVFRGR
jgi:hypothetical protein